MSARTDYLKTRQEKPMSDEDRLICADAAAIAHSGNLHATETAHLTPARRSKLADSIADFAREQTRLALEGQ